MIQPGQALLEYERENPPDPREEAFVASGSYFMWHRLLIERSEDPAAKAREFGYFICGVDGLMVPGQVCDHAEVTLGGGVVMRKRMPENVPLDERQKIFESGNPAETAREFGYYYCQRDGILGLGQICAHAEVTFDGGVIHREKDLR